MTKTPKIGHYTYSLSDSPLFGDVVEDEWTAWKNLDSVLRTVLEAHKLPAGLTKITRIMNPDDMCVYLSIIVKADTAAGFPLLDNVPKDIKEHWSRWRHPK